MAVLEMMGKIRIREHERERRKREPPKRRFGVGLRFSLPCDVSLQTSCMEDFGSSEDGKHAFKFLQSVFSPP